MRSTSAENGLFEESVTYEFNADWWQNALIIQRILSNFSNSELVTLSLVNKLWKYEARSILKQRGNFLAKINSDHPCQDLLDFAAHLQIMAVVPWCGMALNVTTRPDHIDQPAPPGVRLVPDPAYQIILQKLPWRKLSVSLDPAHFEMRYSKCPAFNFVKTILRDKCMVLEELEFNVSYRRRHIEFFAEFFPITCRFPSLRILKLGQDAYGCCPEDWNSCMCLISHAPILQELSHAHVIDIEELRQGAAKTIRKDFQVVPFAEPSTALCRFRRYTYEQINLRIDRTKSYCGLRHKEFSLERFHRIVPMLLEMSHSTLKSLLLHYTLLVPVMGYERWMKNLEELTIWVDIRNADSRIFKLLQKLNMQELCPRLSKVVVEVTREDTPTPEEVDSIFEQGNLMLSDRPLPVYGYIKSLHFKRTFHDSIVPYFTQIFPYVHKLLVKTDDLSIPFHAIWEQWAGLRELEVEMDHSLLKDNVNLVWEQVVPRNLETNICGIFPEELAELSEKNEEFLSHVHIVPVMPCITTFKNLRTFTLHLKPNFYSELKERLTTLISKVAGLIVFARCPHLRVTIRTFLQYRVAELPRDDLRPFTVILDEDVNRFRQSSL